MTKFRDADYVLFLLTLSSVVSLITFFVVFFMLEALSESYSPQKCEILCDSMQYTYVRYRTTLEGQSCECALNTIVFQVK
jgi:nitrate/TMAO reductase-like tetraheme cytochrome c subunit